MGLSPSLTHTASALCQTPACRAKVLAARDCDGSWDTKADGIICMPQRLVCISSSAEMGVSQESSASSLLSCNDPTPLAQTQRTKEKGREVGAGSPGKPRGRCRKALQIESNPPFNIVSA